MFSKLVVQGSQEIIMNWMNWNYNRGGKLSISPPTRITNFIITIPILILYLLSRIICEIFCKITWLFLKKNIKKFISNYNYTDLIIFTDYYSEEKIVNNCLYICIMLINVFYIYYINIIK